MNTFFLKNQTPKGFIALISAVIISTILLGLALTAGASGAFSRFNALNGEYKRVSLALAESCANAALLKIAQNYSYNPVNESVSLGNDGQGRPQTCVIKSVAYPNGKTGVQNTAVITTQAQYPPTNGAFSNITISSTVQNPSFAVPARASVVVQTHVNNNDGGTKQAGDFTMTVAAGNPSPSSFSGAETGVVVYIDPGSYTINGSNDGAYSKSVSAGCAGTLAAGQVDSCVITYDDIPTTATLTVTAVVKNDNGGTWLPSNFPLFIDGVPSNSGVPSLPLTPGFHTASAAATPAGYSASTWGTDCIVLGTGSIALSAGEKKTCTIVYDDNPPPAPICVDTVLMLDRTGSMGGGDLTDERNAANGLLNLYAALTPLPKSAVGVFGAVGSNEPYNANIRQALTTVYSSLTNAVNTGLSSSDGYTNLASAITVSQNEFTANGTPGKGHVLILLSDGGANRPTGNVAGDTGWKFPTANAQNGAGDLWTTPAGAYGASYAADAGAHRHRYSNLGLSVPGTATITNVEIRTDAWSTLSLGSVTLISDGFGTGGDDDDINNWDEEGNDGDSSTLARQNQGSGEDTASTEGGRFAKIASGEWICHPINATGSTSVQLAYYWRGDADAEDNETGIVEYHSGGSCASSSGWVSVASHELDNGNNNVHEAWSPLQSVSLPNGLNGFVRFRNGANDSAEYLRIDGVTVSGLTNTACTLGVDLSWDGGNNWTSEDTQLLTNTATQYTFSGGWGGHTWVQNDFSDANFRIRLRDTNAGPTCIVDTLQARVSYTSTTNPYEAALAAADAAKLAGTEIFTIHFGDAGSGGSDQDFLATIANGTTANGTHQPGSANDLSGSPSSGSIGPNAASVSHTPQNWSNPNNAFSSNNQYTTSTTEGQEQGYSGFGLALPPGATVTGIAAQIEAKSSDTNGCELQTMLSWNNGVSYTSADDGNNSLSGSDQTITFGSSSNMWGRGSWTASELSDANFVVKFRFDDTSGNNCSGATVSVDQVRVQVYYSGAVPENTDNDNFYISPNSSDMPAIFEAIGRKVCPALTATPPAPPPVYGTLLVITHVVNDNGGVAQSSDFEMTVTGTNPSPNTFPMTGTGSPGTTITLDPGFFSVSADTMGLLYDTNLSGCSGTINAGDVLTCTITNDDLPPPSGTTGSALPPSNIIIGSWQETP